MFQCNSQKGAKNSRCDESLHNVWMSHTENDVLRNKSLKYSVWETPFAFAVMGSNSIFQSDKLWFDVTGQYYGTTLV